MNPQTPYKLGGAKLILQWDGARIGNSNDKYVLAKNYWM